MKYLLRSLYFTDRLMMMSNSLVILLMQFSCLLHGTLHTHLTGQLQRLGTRRATTYNSLIAVEVFGDLFKRGVACFHVEEVDHRELETEPDAVEDVVLPFDIVESDSGFMLVSCLS